MSIFCKHKWKILSETVTESPLEQSHRLGLLIKSSVNGHVFTKRYITICACEQCGKLQQFENENF